MDEVWLIIETSGKVGKLGLARGTDILRAVELDATRRHARDLAATVASLLGTESLRAVDLTGIMVSIGPGSYTGLRVGIMSAKALAYALGCPLRAVPTFEAIAHHTSSENQPLWVIADALQGQVYRQHFTAGRVDELRIVSFTDWLIEATATPDSRVSGPGIKTFADRIPPELSIVPEALRDVTIESVFRAGRAHAPLSRDELFALEPLYLRGSSAEEQWKAREQARHAPI